MDIKQALGYELLLTYFARVRSFPCVIPHVYRKRAPLAKTFRASLTLKRLNFRMNPLVCHQQLFADKSLSARVAHVGLLPRMQFHVVFQTAEARHAFSTYFAHVLVISVVAFHVVQVRAEVLKNFGTYGANVFFFYEFWIVGQHVCFVVVHVPKWFVTLVADESNAFVLRVDVLSERIPFVITEIAVVAVVLVVLQVYVSVCF